MAHLNENTKKIIMMVDDDATVLRLGRNSLETEYNVFTMPSSERFFMMLNQVTPDLVLLDIQLPDSDGFEVIRALKRRSETAGTPVIFLTGMNDPESELEGLTLGAVDYIVKPFSPAILRKRVETQLLLHQYNTNLQALVEEKTKTVSELQNALLAAVAEVVEYRDDITGGHVERTQRYLAVLLAEIIRCDLYNDITQSWDLNALFRSAALHDVGKIAIRDNILLKPGRLTTEEFNTMKRHSELGVQIIDKIAKNTSEQDFLYHAKIFAGSHHEWWDGSGYPNHLRGEKIPLQGRLMAIVDVYDALVSERPYKQALSHEAAIEIIRQESGSHFDPELVALLLSKADDFRRISQEAHPQTA